MVIGNAGECDFCSCSVHQSEENSTKRG